MRAHFLWTKAELSAGAPDLTEESAVSKEVERRCDGMSGPEYREWVSWRHQRFTPQRESQKEQYDGVKRVLFVADRGRRVHPRGFVRGTVTRAERNGSKHYQHHDVRTWLCGLCFVKQRSHQRR
jgi:hypothetical protein